MPNTKRERPPTTVVGRWLLGHEGMAAPFFSDPAVGVATLMLGLLLFSHAVWISGVFWSLPYSPMHKTAYDVLGLVPPLAQAGFLLVICGMLYGAWRLRNRALMQWATVLSTFVWLTLFILWVDWDWKLTAVPIYLVLAGHSLLLHLKASVG